jgi:hypothetical protein
MPLKSGLISKNEIILVTNNKNINKLTIDLVKKWNDDKSDSILKVIDLDDYSITTFLKDEKVKRDKDLNEVENIIQKYDVYSYPSIIILRAGNLIENIFGNYNNIFDIVNYYL